ncbi:hypothetical protein L1049_010993 [Liquidambar formosana]|uniref:Uncharacterized protein n=1 Tax=Liquidambar formosana TaxID=63359 RepID=A0AAP0WXT8_LIQFO
MNSYGLPLETALSTSQKLQLDENNLQRQESVRTFLKSQGFSNTHIAKLVTKRPEIFQFRVEKVRPKIQFLIDNGFSGLLLPELIVANPSILRRGLSSQIKPSYDFLKMYLGTNEKIVAAIKRTPWLLTSDLKGTMQPNIDLLISEGVPLHSVAKFIMFQPRGILLKVDRMAHAVETVKKFGLQPSAPMFIHALRVTLSMSNSTWNRKIEVYKSLGWSDEEIESAFKSDPVCLACSEEKIKSISDFFVNTLKLEPKVIIAYPKFLTYGMDTRFRPRYNVLKLLESKKLLKAKKFTWLLTLTEKRFLDEFVIKHLDQIPNLMELYRGNIPASKISL